MTFWLQRKEKLIKILYFTQFVISSKVAKENCTLKTKFLVEQRSPLQGSTSHFFIVYNFLKKNKSTFKTFFKINTIKNILFSFVINPFVFFVYLCLLWHTYMWEYVSHRPTFMYIPKKNSTLGFIYYFFHLKALCCCCFDCVCDYCCEWIVLRFWSLLLF